MTLETTLVKTEIIKPEVSRFDEFIPLYIDNFLERYSDDDLDLVKGTKSSLQLYRGKEQEKFNPILQLAKPEEAETIVELFEQAYKGTYPYREYMDVEAVRNMINGGLVNFILFKDDDWNILGCLKFVLDFEAKRGYQGGMAMYKEYLGKVDLVKAYIASCLYFWKRYKDTIAMWYGECRTAHSKVQYFTKICGILPLAFFGNKDVFLNELESDLFVIGYHKQAIHKYRCKSQPILIPEALDCFNFASERYELGLKKLDLRELRLKIRSLMELHKIYKKTVEESKYGYCTVEYRFEGRDSYFRFLHTPQIQNIENVEYSVDSLEELFICVLEFLRYAQKNNIRYIEAFVSAYEPNHQKVFNEAGMVPRGYVPSWAYNNETKKFEDCVVFNCYEGEINPDIQLIPEGWDLLESIRI